ncbi:unnamed protein product, partial [Mesorhabditis spiculigera]
MGKQGTKGQKEIYQENRATLQQYGLAALVSSGLYLVLGLVLWTVTTNEWVWWGVSAFIQLCAILLMRSMAKAALDERGHVLDAGLDLNDPSAFGEYCKDIIILTTIVQLLSLYTGYAHLILLAFPGYGGYMIIFKFLIPWATAPTEAPEGEDMDDRKGRKRDKIKYARR